MVPDCEILFNQLKTAISNSFWPTFFEDMISDAEESLLSLPNRLGSMGVFDLVNQAPESFFTLRDCFEKLISAISGTSGFSEECHLDHAHETHVSFPTTNNFVSLNHRGQF